MKTKILSLFLLTFYLCSIAQSDFLEHIVLENISIIEGVNSVMSADLDGDGDMDILTSSMMDGVVAWFENTDGSGTFGPIKVISDEAIGARSIFACDIDGDGDSDILSASSGDNKIAWYENLDGLGNFGTQEIISIYVGAAIYVYARDIDGDEDMDVLAASQSSGLIVWFENMDGNGSFSTQKHIAGYNNFTTIVFADDMDGDGDIDALSGSVNDHRIAWYENMDGVGNFGTGFIISTNTEYPTSVYTVDIDGDTDIDVLSASCNDNTIAWFENIDGIGSFGQKNIISNHAFYAQCVYSCDLDNDGDMDVLSASSIDHKIAWYENINGQGNFSAEQIISLNANGANSVYASDIDGDGDIDILSASWGDHKIAWYENPGDLSIDQDSLLKFSVYPNPTTGIIKIQSETNIAEIAIYNQLGQLVLPITNQQVINISKLEQGLYFIKVKDTNANLGIQKVIIE